MIALYPGTSIARDNYFIPNCGSCHAVSAPTCNGCHVHGTHILYDSNGVKTQNLKISTDKTSYVEGESIVVTLEGGNMPDFKGWVGVRVYDSAGVEVVRKQAQLGCNPYPVEFGNKCDLPMKLSVPAKVGWTELYMSWAGNLYDRSGAKFGVPLSAASFGAGQRPLLSSDGNQVANHLEEIVVSGQFTVTALPPTPVPTPTPMTDSSVEQPPANESSTSDDASGSGVLSNDTDAGSKNKSAAAGMFDVYLLFAALLGYVLRSGVRYFRRLLISPS